MPQLEGIDPAEQVVADRIATALRRLRRRSLPDRLRKEIYTFGSTELTPRQFDALHALSSQPEWHMNEISQQLGVDPSTGSRTLASLIKLKLAQRIEDRVDGRYAVLKITKQGLRHLESTRSKTHSAMQDVIGRIPIERRMLLASLLEEYDETLAAYAEEHDMSDAAPKVRLSPSRER